MNNTSRTDKKTGEIAYRELMAYTQRTHNVCVVLIRVCMITFFALPAILLIFMWLADIDKVFTLIIWIIGMFILAVTIIIIGFFDSQLKDMRRNIQSSGTDDLGSLAHVDAVDSITRLIKEHLLEEIKPEDGATESPDGEGENK